MTSILILVNHLIMATINEQDLQNILQKLHEKFSVTTRDKPRNFSNKPEDELKLLSFQNIVCKIAGNNYFKLRPVNFLKIKYSNKKKELFTLNVPADTYFKI